MKSIAVLGVLTVTLAACVSSAPLYDGPGTFQDFANAQYQCIQETTGTNLTAEAYINRYGAGVTASTAPSCAVFTACLAAKGYYESPTGAFDATPIAITCTYP